jgi:bacterioferritin (cytochrome b1)
MATEAPDRKKMIDLLNDDLSREYQAIMAYVVYSQVLKGTQYMNIAGELEKHASEELDHAIKISNQIDYFGGMPTATAKPVKLTEDPVEMLRADLENERSPSPTTAPASARPTRWGNSPSARFSARSSFRSRNT